MTISTQSQREEKTGCQMITSRGARKVLRENVMQTSAGFRSWLGVYDNATQPASHTSQLFGISEHLPAALPLPGDPLRPVLGVDAATGALLVGWAVLGDG